MSREGIPINNYDPKPEIRKNAENARDWEYREEAQYLYGMAILFKDRFLDPVLLTDRGRLPDPVISFDDLRNRKTLAAYTLHRNPQGLLDEITFNTAHYVEEEGQKVWAWGRWAQLETLLHEQVHLWQENFANKHKPGRVAHDKIFVEKCESLGLHPMPVVGSHYAVADGVFAQLMAELGIPRPDDVPSEKGGKKDWFRPEKKEGRSTLHKWECPNCGLKVRVGRAGDPGLIHHVCSEQRGEKVFLVNADGLPHTIFEAGSEKLIGSREKDDALLNFVNQQAQEAILNPNLPDSYKDAAVEAAVGTIQKVAERKAVYYAKHGEGRKTRRQKLSNTVHEGSDDEERPLKNVPEIIEQLNENLKAGMEKDTETPTVESIALNLGISRSTLFGWVKNDQEFSQTLVRLKTVQENDPFKTGTAEDGRVNAMMVALLLMEKAKSKSEFS